MHYRAENMISRHSTALKQSSGNCKFGGLRHPHKPGVKATPQVGWGVCGFKLHCYIN